MEPQFITSPYLIAEKYHDKAPTNNPHHLQRKYGRPNLSSRNIPPFIRKETGKS